MEKKFGIPIANSDNVFEVARSLGIVKWKTSEKVMSAADYLKREHTPSEKEHLKYLLPSEVVSLINPKGEVFRGFRFLGPSGALVFTLLPGNFIVVCAEFMHGCDQVMLDLPGGMIEPGENPEATAKKEFEDESGIILEKVIPLSTRGIPSNARRIHSWHYIFIGIEKKPIQIKEQVLDSMEYVGVMLVHLDDWIKLIEKEAVDAKSVAATFKALINLGLIKSSN